MEVSKRPRPKKELPARIALSIDEAAAMIGLSRWTVCKMLEEGALPGFVLRTGKRKKIWRIREDVLQKWIEQREQETKKLIHASGDRRLQAV
jgi:excisionase family DNA binding protein